MVRARREPEFILVRADRCPPGLVEELRAAHLPVQTLTRTFPGRPAELWYRLPADVARGLRGAAGSAQPVLERDEGVATHVPVSSLLTEEELARVERAIGHVVYMAEREERLLLYVARANGVAVASAPA